MAEDPEGCLALPIRRIIIGNGAVWDLLDQTGAKNRCGNTEYQVVTFRLYLEIFLFDVAPARITRGIDPMADNKQSMHTAVTRFTAVVVVFVLEPRFTNGAVAIHKERDDVIS